MKFKLKLKISLFWRNFSVLLSLFVVCFALWSQGFSLWQQYPRAHTLAGQLTTAVNITRAALLYANPTHQEPLLQALNTDERVSVYQREFSDITVPFETSTFMYWLISITQDALGKETEIAQSVNGEQGLWVSFHLGNNLTEFNAYWLKLDISRLEVTPSNPTLWWLWMTLAIVIAAFGAALMTRRLTKPLSQLADRTLSVADHSPYQPLPESGAPEIAQVNKSMNQMVRALAAQEAERTFMMASLSHDLRTPLTRLRLETEMANLPADTFQAMVSDIEHMDEQLKQLTDYVASNHAKPTLIALDEIVENSLIACARDTSIHINRDITPCMVMADSALIKRTLGNIIENARRYGRNNHQGDITLMLDVILQRDNTGILLSFHDHGLGVDPDILPSLLQPFTRGDTARSGAQGHGLGLAIVQNVMQQHGGKVMLSSKVNQGFTIKLWFPVPSQGS